MFPLKVHAARMRNKDLERSEVLNVDEVLFEMLNDCFIVFVV